MCDVSSTWRLGLFWVERRFLQNSSANCPLMGLFEDFTPNILSKNYCCFLIWYCKGNTFFRICKYFGRKYTFLLKNKWSLWCSRWACSFQKCALNSPKGWFFATKCVQIAIFAKTPCQNLLNWKLSCTFALAFGMEIARTESSHLRLQPH